jgi:SAM-dependent methyltransferase
MTLLDFGAGRGAIIEASNPSYAAKLARLKGDVRKLIGVDIDPAVHSNAGLDETHVMKVGTSLPFDAESFDLIYADWVLEHIETPTQFASEISRVLKKNGWFCARTPNKWSYIALGASLLPDQVHGRVLHRVQTLREEADVFPKYYRMNTMSAIQKYFPETKFVNASYMRNAEPAYFGGSTLLYHLIDTFQAIPMCNTTMLVFVKKL